MFFYITIFNPEMVNREVDHAASILDESRPSAQRITQEDGYMEVGVCIIAKHSDGGQG